MSSQTTIRTKDSTTPELVDTKTTSLEAVVEEVRHDSHHEAKQYLEETQVPHGGE